MMQVAAQTQDNYDLDRVLLTQSFMSGPDFFYGPELKQALFEDVQILCIGAGGLGCEILKNLALSGLRNIHVIDLDTIDVTNLNRQFLFRREDVGKSKAEVAANFIMKRVPGTKVYHYQQKIQEFPLSFYEQFPVIIAGLDNIEARRWINRVVHKLVKKVNLYNQFKDDKGEVDPTTLHHLVDGGTEGLNGQARVITPYKTACYECTLSQLPKQTQFQMCTIANTPRIPEHCIAYAYEVLWPNTFPEKKLDKDSYDDMNWIYQEALKRAQHFGISGVTYKLTMGVVKNIIPAVASTNAIIAASCVNEAFKILTGNGEIMDNYFNWIGQAEGSGVNTSIIRQERIPDCPVCQVQEKVTRTSRTTLVKDLLKQFKADNNIGDEATFSTEGGCLLFTHIQQLQDHHNYKLELTFEELMQKGLLKAGEKLVCMLGGLNNDIEIKLGWTD